MKMMFWIGYFPTEETFERYLDIEKGDGETEGLRTFCQEMGLDDFDEDFLIAKYLKESDDINDFLDFVPAKTQLLQEACAPLNLQKANALICYSTRHGITPSQAVLASSVSYLGDFQYSTKEINSLYSTSGMEFSVFIGNTDKSEAEFMEYFNQDDYIKVLQDYQAGISRKKPAPELRCQFCKDVGIDYYYPELLSFKMVDAPLPGNVLLEAVVNEPMLYDVLSFILDQKGIESANVAFCYVANGFRDKSKDKHISIYKRDTPDLIKRKKKDIDELDSYNGLTFLETLVWE